ncbi:SRPBCC family protein [Pedobacter montanisoli]|uniref:SRPBCC domain-containing protein n=1 Tax=Pedobacter montanisoli TaxID=2923277 RepID=A0ABS9ZX74_9SPHI|nr:SRPBCC domain-containing protein [Pedobacter montanisoli]MCJ0742890.1 SRPBCC domain-containing protein [Pedobacter montanisoli]
MKNQDIEITVSIKAPVTKVWNAISSAEEMKNWYFTLKDFKTVSGFKFEFWAGPAEKQYLHCCEVIDVEPLQRLSYTWRYEGFPGNSLVIWILDEQQNGQTLLTLKHVDVETLKNEDPAFDAENFVTGWEAITQNLKAYLER